MYISTISTKCNKKVKGFTITELLVTIAVISMLVTGVFFVASFLTKNAEYSKMKTYIVLIHNNMSEVHDGFPLCEDTALNSSYFIESEGFPEELVLGSNLRHIFGSSNSLVLGCADYGGGTDNAFEIQLLGLNKKQCIGMVKEIDTYPDRLLIENATLGEYEALADSSSTIDPIGVAAACDNNANDLTIIFKK